MSLKENNMKHTEWWKQAVIYQIYPRSFCDKNNDGLGDIPGIISKLDYLKDLGINCVWLSPIYDSPQEDNGYDIANYRDIYKPFGTLNDFKIMLEEMHKRDIKLIMDLVINHTSSEHPWFKEAISDKNSPYRDYYIIKKGKNNGKKPPTNWTGFFGESAWEKIPNSDEYYLHLFAKGQPDLNWKSTKLREEVKNILKYWLDMGVDGFRCDVINLLSKTDTFQDGKSSLVLVGKENFINGPHLHEYLRELYDDVYANYDTMTVGETTFTTLEDALRLTGKNNELDMIFNFDVVDVDDYFGVKYIKKNFKLSNLKKVFNKWQFGLEGASWNTLFLENHDQRRSLGRFNTNETKYRKESAKLLAVTYMCLKGTPFIYQGQEIGMTNPKFSSFDEISDVELKNIVKLRNKLWFLKPFITKKRMLSYSRENARTPMQWDDSEFAGFSLHKPWIKVNPNKDEINVKESLVDNDSIYHFYQKLIYLKRNEPALIDGTYIPLFSKDKKVLAYHRKLENEDIVIISNFSKKRIRRNQLSEFKEYKTLLSNYPTHAENVLEPYETHILKK